MRKRGARGGEHGAWVGELSARAQSKMRKRVTALSAKLDGTAIRELHSDENPRQESEDCASEKRSRASRSRV